MNRHDNKIEPLRLYAAATVDGTTDLLFKADDEQCLLRSSITIC
jgi:hypothetical protein